jgi:hypothetical protein
MSKTSKTLLKNLDDTLENAGVRNIPSLMCIMDINYVKTTNTPLRNLQSPGRLLG